MAETVERERSGRVEIWRLWNPPHNFMTRDVVVELEAALAEVEDDEDVGAVVVTGGREGSFVTHYDIAEILAGSEDVGLNPGPGAAGALLRTAGGMSRLPGGAAALSRTPARGLIELRRFHELFGRMNRAGVVFIAAINGVATGAGCELALACDIRYAARGDFGIGLPEMTLGFNPGGGGTQRLARLLGAGRALEMMLEGRTCTPDEAEEIGLVHRVLGARKLLDEAIATGERLARRPRLAVQALKRSVYEGSAAPLEDGLALERKWFLATAGTPESKRAMAAYVEQVEREDRAPWADRDALRAWQEGTAAAGDGGEQS